MDQAEGCFQRFEPEERAEDSTPLQALFSIEERTARAQQEARAFHEREGQATPEEHAAFEERMGQLYEANQTDTEDWHALANLLSKEEQKAAVHRIVKAFVARLEAGEDAFSGAIDAVNLLMPRSRRYKEEDIVDTFMEMIPELYRTFPEAAPELANVLDQNAQVVRPEVYLRTQAKILRDPDIGNYAQTGALAGLAYHAAYGLQPFLKKELSRIEEMPVDEAITLFTLLHATAQYGRDWDFSEDVSGEMLGLLRQFAERTTSALLKRKAETVLRPGSRAARQDVLPVVIEGVAGRVAVRSLAKGYAGVYRGAQLFGVLPLEEGKETYEKEAIQPLASLSELRGSPKADAEAQARTVQAREDYAMLIDPTLLDGLEKDYGFSVRALTVREQLWFTASLRGMAPKEEGAIEEFTQKFGIDGARAFLTVESGDAFRDVVLRIGERLPEETAKAVFARYAEFAEWAQATAETMSKEFFKEQASLPFNTQVVEDRLLERGKQLLLEAERAPNPEAVLSQLETARADAVLFASIFRQLFKGSEQSCFVFLMRTGEIRIRLRRVRFEACLSKNSIRTIRRHIFTC